MPLLSSDEKGNITSYGFGEIVSRTFVISDASMVPSDPIPLLYDYFLVVIRKPFSAKIKDYFEAYNQPMPEGMQMPPLTLHQQLEIQEAAMDNFLLMGVSEADMKAYDDLWIKPLRDALMLPSSNLNPTAVPPTSSIVLNPAAAPTETASTPSVPVSSTTNATAKLATQPLTAKLLAHPLAQLLQKMIGA